MFGVTSLSDSILTFQSFVCAFIYSLCASLQAMREQIQCLEGTVMLATFF